MKKNSTKKTRHDGKQEERFSGLASESKKNTHDLPGFLLCSASYSICPQRRPIPSKIPLKTVNIPCKPCTLSYTTDYFNLQINNQSLKQTSEGLRALQEQQLN